jgi:hypothetical protein
MTMQASTLRILEAAQFQPMQARALAEAIEGEIHAAEIVTVPILDARLSELKQEIIGVKHDVSERGSSLKQLISETETRLLNRMIVLGLTAVGLVISSVFFIVLNLKK